MKLLDQVLQPDNLRQAWEQVAERGGSGGIDRISIPRWRRNWEERLVNLAQSVRAQTYRPRRPRVLFIPKKDGSKRKISILTVADRVLQRAVLRVVDDIFDRQFLDCSYGYRAGRSFRVAVPKILAYRDSGRLWVVDADIDACFDSLRHELILKKFQEGVQDKAVLRLLQLWLRVGDTNNNQVGISMGAVISPLLCNIYLDPLDQALVANGLHPVRYADDFCVFCASEAEAKQGLALTGQILAAMHLQLEPQKTRIAHFDPGFDFLGIHFYRDSYSFVSNQKRIEIDGDFRADLFYDYVPAGYEE
jgi:group II intron reverse transcriptase/maturase